MNASPLSKAARAVLSEAVRHERRCADLPAGLPVAAGRAVIRSLLRSGLIQQVPVVGCQPGWRTADGGAQYALQITDAGVQAITSDAARGQRQESAADETLGIAAQTPATTTSPTIVRPSVPVAARTVLAAWDDPSGSHPALSGAIEALRSAMRRHRSVTRTTASRQPRPDTKRALVLGLLHRPEGATVAQVAEATGWARHTVHGFFAGLKKHGPTIEVLERVRQVGAGQGAKGSYTIYRVAEAG